MFIGAPRGFGCAGFSFADAPWAGVVQSLEVGLQAVEPDLVVERLSAYLKVRGIEISLGDVSAVGEPGAFDN